MEKTPQTQPVKIPNPVEGIIRSASIEDVVSEPSSVQEAVNVHFDRMGATTVRPGLTAYSAALSGAPSYFTAWSTTGTTSYQNPQLIAQVGTGIYSLIGGSWVSKGTNGSTAKVRATQFINYTYFVNGNGGDTVKSYDGNTYSTANTASLPKGDYISGGLEGRLWVADKASNRIYYTDQTPTGVSLNGGADYIYFSPPSGQQITGMKLYQRAMMVFMHDYIYRVYGATSYDGYPAYFVGTYSQESIVQAKDTMYFHHSTGFYRFSYESQPQEISRRIIDVVQAIPRANWDNIFGWADFDHVYWHCGEVTVGGVLFRNLVCRFTISTQVWTLYDYFGDSDSERTLTASAMFDDSTNLNILVGVSDGNVASVNKGTTDLGEDIFYSCIGRWINLTPLQSSYQSLKSVAVMHQNGGGADFMAQTDKAVNDKWIQIGRYDNNFVTLFQSVDADVLPFNRIRFRTKGQSKGLGPIFGTTEILSYENIGFTYQ